jgi:hypothetical protein
MGSWLFGQLAVWAVGRLGSWPFGQLAVWAVGRLGSWPFGQLAVWAVGRLGSWLFGQLAVWALGCLGSWQQIYDNPEKVLLGTNITVFQASLNFPGKARLYPSGGP